MEELVSGEVISGLERGALILTGNERAARAVRLAWDRRQALSGKNSWEPAKTLSWRSWTQQLWKTCLLDGRVTSLLLSPLQEQRVWCRVITAGRSSGRLQNTASLADLAARTWRQLCAYEGTRRFDKLIASLQGDLLHFARWTQAFQQICVEESLLSESLLDTELLGSVERKDLDDWNQGILLLGFDRIVPSQMSLILRCRALGLVLEVTQLPSLGEGTVVIAADESEELRGCARWLREKLRLNPGVRIGVIVTDLEREMSEIDATFRELLAPELEDIAADTQAAPYEFSLGRPLSHEPMVQCALDLLHWFEAPLRTDQVSRLLLSPYFAATAHIAARAEFDQCSLRSELRLRPEVTLKVFLHELGKASVTRSRLSSLLQVVDAMEFAQSHSGLRRQGHGDWAEWIRGWLVRAHWGYSQMPSSSREYQVRERWEGAVDDLASLDFMGELVTLSDALVVLERVVKDRIFAPQSREAPVQVLGPLEAAGERFDAVWILRTGELSWPLGSTSLPLLPSWFQRELGMPGTDANREREAAQQLTRRLAGSATEIIFSYSQSLPEGGRQQGAAVIRELGFPTAAIACILTPIAANPIVELEHVPDGTAVAALPMKAHRGGARILELQAACGFRAFAELRLGCSGPRDREAGLNAMERGNLVHTALETFWTSVKGQRELIAIGPTQRDELLRQAVFESFAHLDRVLTNRWDAAYLDAQRGRLISLLSEWLALEERRPEFTVVAHEKRQDVTIGPIQISIRVDRVDSVEGQQVVLDYKTGLASPSEWLGDRPDQPQLPLYAVLSQVTAAQASDAPAPLGAVGFAQVRTGNGIKLRGLEATPGILSTPGSRARSSQMDTDTFEEQVARWRDVLHRLADEFARGDTRIRPKRYPSTCERCDQRLLCRLDTSQFESDLDTAPPLDADENSFG